jgi:hypothetical protein
MAVPNKKELAMPNEGIQELVVDQTLSSEENLAVACAVCSAFEPMVGKIVSKFLKKLEPALKTTLGDEWKIKAEFADFKRERHVLTLGKTPWFNTCPIQLRVDRALRNAVYIGILKEQKPFTIIPAQDEYALRGRIAEKFSGIEHNLEWVAYWYVQDNKYALWNAQNPETLRNMYFQTDDFVRFFEELIVDWARMVSPVLDRH